jgi:hypoxanthine phosphoribosyltransferase
MSEVDEVSEGKKYEIAKTLFTEEEILEKAKEIGKRISEDFEGEELVCLGVLRGSVVWFSDLIKRISIPIKFDFIRVSSYKGKESTGRVEIHRDTWLDLKDKNILIVEDIVDTGSTCKYVAAELKNRGAKKIRTCTLVNKQERRKVEFTPDYVGFEIPNTFIVGYGLDIDDEFRNLNYIAEIKEA